MHQTWENGKKTNLGPDIGPFGTNLVSQIFSTRCSTLLQTLYVISRKANESSLKKWQET